jgi:hypothetical protein
MIARELVYAALYARLLTIPGIVTTSRKLMHWADVTEFPAMFQAQKSETVSKTKGVDTKLEMMVDVYVYVKVEDGQPSSPALNDMLDKVAAAIAPIPGSDNKQTLGGLVEDCVLRGQILTDEGTLGELAVAIIPIQIQVV